MMMICLVYDSSDQSNTYQCLAIKHKNIRKIPSINPRIVSVDWLGVIYPQNILPLEPKTGG